MEYRLFVAHNLTHRSVTTLPRPLVGWEGVEFGQLILRKIIKKCCHQMSDLKAKMHQNRFPLGELSDPQIP